MSLILVVYHAVPTPAPMSFMFGIHLEALSNPSGSYAKGSSSHGLEGAVFCVFDRRVLGRSGQRIAHLPMPSKSACLDARAVCRCDGERRPPVSRMSGIEEKGRGDW